jgi:phage shock protein A
MQSIDELANVITELNSSEQQALLDKVAQLNFQKGLHDLAEKYRARLARESKLTSPPEQIWLELHRIREEIAEHDYPA